VPSFPDQTRHRKVQLAAGGAVTLLALVLVGWLLLRPAPAVPDGGTTPLAGSTRASAAQTTAVGPAATEEPGTAAAAPSTPAAQPAPALTVAPPTTATAGPLASVPGGAQVLFVGDGIDPSGTANDWSALAASTLGPRGRRCSGSCPHRSDPALTHPGPAPPVISGSRPPGAARLPDPDPADWHRATPCQ